MTQLKRVGPIGAMAAMIVAVAALACGALRPLPAEAVPRKSVASTFAGPVGVRRGQTARLFTLSTAAAMGAPRSVDLKFLVRGSDGWSVVSRTFQLTAAKPGASVELRVADNGGIWLIVPPAGVHLVDPDAPGAVMEKVQLGNLAGNLATLDICGHEITHGVSEAKSEPPHSSTLTVLDDGNGAPLTTLAMERSDGSY